MSMGQAIAEARQGMTQAELAEKLHLDRTSVGKYETGKRRVPEHMRATIASTLDDPVVYFAAEEEATGGVTIPYLNGERIERSLSAMKELARYEALEALEHLDRVRFHKPPEYWTEEEKAEVQQVMYELLDAAASIQNLVAVSCKDYGFSPKKIYKEWRNTVKKRGWMK
ncbi:helix-turn-helix domain-containing protein [Novibacillus thermophilus]|uniref:HTH cro/C1-type domain-containing protein n=1 Tax=Novibacillus thermophilus TaxID=1471761 RepID=A0A1U9K5F6_9BACL|nr:helix-turn-helix transcriptional regulator [Novibacillus thermophilus]AQS55271.1 hypothetical protein B0W44_05235 [Novibacillus thermophilus]